MAENEFVMGFVAPWRPEAAVLFRTLADMAVRPDGFSESGRLASRAYDGYVWSLSRCGVGPGVSNCGTPTGASIMSKASTTASAVVSDDIADVLGEVGIFTAAGDPVKFRDLWDQQEGVAVVALLRHFGCFCSWELAAALKESKEKFESAGVKLIAVGVGTPDRAQILAERLPFPLDSLYCDPNREAYDVLGLYYGLGRTFFNPASLKVFSRYGELKKAMKNYTIKATPEDRSSVLQQGGMFVFKGKKLLYARKDEGTGDHAPLDDIFNICCKVPTTA